MGNALLQPPHDPYTVLVVDDEESIRESLFELFDVPAVRVTIAADTARALTALRESAFDLVVTDLRLGGKHDGGLQVMAAAALLAPDAPVIALTAYPQTGNRLAAQRLGATYFLEKPADLVTISEIAASHGVPSALPTEPRTTGR